MFADKGCPIVKEIHLILGLVSIAIALFLLATGKLVFFVIFGGVYIVGCLAVGVWLGFRVLRRLQRDRSK